MRAFHLFDAEHTTASLQLKCDVKLKVGRWPYLNRPLQRGGAGRGAGYPALPWPAKLCRFFSERGGFRCAVRAQVADFRRCTGEFLAAVFSEVVPELLRDASEKSGFAVLVLADHWSRSVGHCHHSGTYSVYNRKGGERVNVVLLSSVRFGGKLRIAL